MGRILLGGSGGPGGARGLGLAALLLAALYALLALPLLAGAERLVLRDTLVTHRPLKAFGAAALAAGEVPVINPTWALGQPFAGNPNALPFYPGNLAYLVLPFEGAFHFHFVLHGLIAFAAMRQLAAALGASSEGALFAGATYAGSGYLLSTWSFYNLLAVVAWAPFVLWGIVRGGRRGLLLGGVACGLMLLGGEPMTAALVVPAMALAGISRHGLRRGLLGALVVGGLGALIASPQLVATLRVLPWSVRALEGVDPRVVGAQDLHPARLLELVLPLPWGWPSDFGRLGTWSKRVTPFVPYIFTLHIGVVGLAAALAGVRRAGAWAGLAAAGLLGAWLGGQLPGVLSALSGGVFRYPQKLLFWFTVGAAVTAGLGFDRLLGSRRAGRALLATGGAVAAGALLLWLGRAPWTARLTAAFAAPGAEATAAAHAVIWIVGLGLAGLLLAFAGWGAGQGSALALVAAQGLALTQLLPVVPRDEAALYREAPPFAAALGGRRAVLVVPQTVPAWEEGAAYPGEVHRPAGLARLLHLDLDASTGIRRGLTYPLAPDLEGIYSPLHTETARSLRRASWPERLPWLRRLGVEAVVRARPEPVDGLVPLARESRWGVETTLAAVEGTARFPRWPRAVAAIADPGAAFRAVAAGAIAAEVAVAPRPIAQDPGGRIELLSERADRLVFEVESLGGVAVLGRAFQPLYRARLDDGRELPTLPVDLTLLGVEVPPGRHRITVVVSSRPEKLALLVSLAAAAAALAVALRRRG